jgi:hypothetical protein
MGAGAAAAPTADAGIAELVRAYEGALRFTDTLPALGRVRLEPEAPPEEATRWAALARRLRTRRPWVARPLVRWFVESHARRQFEAIARHVRFEAAGATGDPGAPPMARSRMLDELAREMFSWRRGAAGLAGLVALSPLAVAQYVLQWVEPLLAAVGMPLGLLIMFLAVASVAYVAYWALVVPLLFLGFRPKRAIFCGGHTGPALWSVSDAACHWRRKDGAFPTTNVYALEDRVFRQLGAAKGREVPLDLYAHPTALFGVPGALVWTFIGLLIARDAAGDLGTIAGAAALFVVLPWVGVVLLYRDAVARFRRRPS